MGLNDRKIAEGDRCSACGGSGWTWWAGDAPDSVESTSPEGGRWIVCRECIGTGRTDHNGRKRQKPTAPPAA